MDPTLKRVILSIATTLLVLQFLLSGVQKLVNTRGCAGAKIMEKLFGDRCAFNVTVLVLAGIWEVVASIAALATTFLEIAPLVRSLALLSLAVFTVLATLMFKVYPKLKYYGLISNVLCVALIEGFTHDHV